METLLNEDIKEQVRQVFTQLDEPVHVLFFGQKEGCYYCDDTRQLLEEVVALSDLLSLQTYDLEEDAAIAGQYGVDRAPGIVITAKDGDQIRDYGIRYSGIPAGHEFSSLIHDILLVSGRDSGLEQSTREGLSQLTQPVHLQVFVTPTCPYCPRAVVLAHHIAMEIDLVQAEMIEASEFPELVTQYEVSSVPQTTINDGAGTVIGAVPEEYLLAEILRATAQKGDAPQ